LGFGQFRDIRSGPQLGFGQFRDIRSGPQLRLGQFRDICFGPFLGVPDPVDGVSDPVEDSGNTQNGIREPADLLLMLRLHFPHLLHVRAKLGLLFENKLHGAAHFLVGHGSSRVVQIN
jgi:hypothetical protein